MAKRNRVSRFRAFLRLLLHLGDSPKRTAGAFALGVFLSFSPLWGLHTVLGLLAAFAFRLNRLAVLVGVYTNTPWTIAPAASLGTAIGFWMVGEKGRLPKLSESSLLSREFWSRMFADIEHLLLPFFLGNLIVAAIAASAAYFILRSLLLRRARKKRERAAHASTP